jgi:2-polyprenyl-6-methoxyphenol hydroxylase-like FAD-dependent oxidoreductase
MAGACHRVVVAERAGEMREIGAALSLWPNALEALAHLGVADEVRAQGLEAPTASIRSTSGASIARFDTEGLRRALGGLPVVVLRAALQAALLAVCGRQGVEIRLGQSVEEVRLEEGRVLVITSDVEAVFDAVVGADGINSKVRTAVEALGQPRDCDRIAWRAVIPEPPGPAIKTWLTVGVGSQLIASPAPDHMVYWAADTPGIDESAFGDGDPRDILRRRFAGWHQPISELIEATPADALIVNRIHDRRPPKALRRGPILLVGDAAHAMTPDLGQGACQAIEDAAVLLTCARSRPNVDPAVLFESFEQVRLRRVRQLVRDSYLLGRVATAPYRVAAGARDMLTRLVPETINNRRLAVYASGAALRRQLAEAAR